MLNAIIDNEIMVFIVVVCLMAADFWTVKNVTGRILVGLRWENQIDEEGNEQWIFESKSAAEGFY